MSYNSLINSNINKAFYLLKDLAEDIYLVKKTTDGFDFNTGESNLQTSSSVLTKGIVTDSEKKSIRSNVIKKIIMFRIEEVGDINSYDTVSYLGNTWRIGPIIKSTQYISIVEIYKEV